MPEWFINIVLPEKLIFQDSVWKINSVTENKNTWSFTDEWKEHAATMQTKTWDMTAQERLKQFYIETQTMPDEMPGKIILDAGYGKNYCLINLTVFVFSIPAIPKTRYVPATKSFT